MSPRFPLVIRLLVGGLTWLLLLVAVAWAFGAIWFDLPKAEWRHPAAILFLCLVAIAFVFLRPRRDAKLSVLLAISLIVLWWRTLQPSNERTWQPDAAETAWAEIKGDEVILHNVRNCAYRTETDYVARWETRTVNLSKMSGLDLAVVYWGSPYIAHPIVSFRFGDALPVAFSIEARKEMRESYSTIGGVYRHYELVYICADERDVLRLRTNFRRNENVYLYRVPISPAQARTRFLEYVDTLNDLHTRARWYNALTTNCTTAIRDQHPADERIPWDWRLLVNGKADELMYERKIISSGGLPFAELKQRSLINERAHAANDDPAFSRLIRIGLPGFDSH